MATITLKEFGKKIDRFKNCINKKGWQLIAMKRGEGLLKERIFSEGKATNGSLIGQPPVAQPPLVGVYSKSHGKRRIKAARSVAKKDLFLRGDLLRSLTVGTNSGDLVLGLATAKSRLIAEAQQEQTGKRIFQASTGEAREIADAAIKELEICLKRKLK